jgi:hypothetical protein
VKWGRADKQQTEERLRGKEARAYRFPMKDGWDKHARKHLMENEVVSVVKQTTRDDEGITFTVYVTVKDEHAYEMGDDQRHLWERRVERTENAIQQTANMTRAEREQDVAAARVCMRVFEAPARRSK